MKCKRKSNQKDNTVEHTRNSFLKYILSSSATAQLIDSHPANAADSSFTLYKNTQCGFQVQIPSAWEKSEQSLPDRRNIDFFVDPLGSSETLVFIAYTPVRDDFTSLGSFGSVDQVGQMTILPKGRIAGIENNESVMLSAESKRNAYFFDYTVTVDEQIKRHFRSIFYLSAGGTGGAGSVLVTLTAQTPQSRYDEMKPIFDQIMDSFDKLK